MEPGETHAIITEESLIEPFIELVGICWINSSVYQFISKMF